MTKTKTLWEYGLAFLIPVLILASLFYMETKCSAPPCQTIAHKTWFPIATPDDAYVDHIPEADLQGWYETYRQQYFGSKMPDAKVIYADLPGLMGRTEKNNFGDFVIRIDKASNPAPKEVLFTLLHEMCHIDMWQKEFDEHGRLWQYDMHRLADEGAFESIW